MLKSDIKLRPHSALSVPVQMTYTNSVLLFPATSKNDENEKYSIPSCIIDKNQNTVVVINNNSKELLLPQGRILGRAFQVDLPKNYSEILQMKSVMSLDIAEVKFNKKALSKMEQSRFFKLLSNHEDCFAKNTSELGVTDLIEFEINLERPEPIFYRPYRYSEPDKAIIRSKVKDLLENNIIRPSSSAFASPAVLVKKKNGDHRLCVDYRKLNSQTIKDRYPLNHIEDQINCLRGKKYFTSLDLSQGYYQIKMSPDSINKTAFVTQDGQFEFLRMPFGVSNAPITFQRLINNLFVELRDQISLYLDDILISSGTIEGGLNILKRVLEILKNANLKLNIEKCYFFETSIDYLGYEVSLEGIKPGRQKINAVANFPKPKTLHQLRQFLGLTSYFRKFIKNHAMIISPLSNLLKKDVSWTWAAEQEDAFNEIKQLLTSRPVLSIYDPKLETELHTDASSSGIAGILLQKHNSVFKPVMYFSRATSRDEKVFHSYELETLAVVESIKRFYIYLAAIHFTVVTDCSAVRSTFTKRDLLPRIARWWLNIQDYDFEIKHRPGNKMLHVDALSRNIPTTSTLTIGTDDWFLSIQLQDPALNLICRKLKSDDCDKQTKNTYLIKDHRLYRKTADQVEKLVIPKSARFNILRKYHDEVGHLGYKKCESLIKNKFWFQGMTKFIKKYVYACLDCAYKRSQYGRKEGFLFPIDKPDQPLHTWHIDHLGPYVKSVGGYCYILMVVDSYSKYLFARPSRTVRSGETIKILKDLFSLFSVPKRIVSDCGKAFKSKQFREFSQEYKFQHVLNAVASPRSNGQVERYNLTLTTAIGTTVSDESEWCLVLSDVRLVVWGINNSVNSSTGMTPHKLMFGFDQLKHPDLDRTTAVVDRKQDSQIAKENMDKQTSKMKRNFDSKRKPARSYRVDDLVLWSGSASSRKEACRKTGLKFGGPYKISKVHSNNRYTISALKGMKGYKKYVVTVPVDQLKTYTGGVVEPSDLDSSVNSTDELIDLLEG
nr:unnamed protein product [Callosobruchus analis]